MRLKQILCYLLFVLTSTSFLFAAEEEANSYRLGVYQTGVPLYTQEELMHLEGAAKVAAFARQDSQKVSSPYSSLINTMVNNFSLVYTNMGKDGLEQYEKKNLIDQKELLKDSLESLYAAHEEPSIIEKKEEEKNSLTLSSLQNYPPITCELVSVGHLYDSLLSDATTRENTIKDLCKSENLDGIIIVLVTKINEYTRVRVFFYDSLTQTFHLPYDKIEEPDSSYAIQESVLSLFEANKRLVRVENSSPSLSILYLPEDDKERIEEKKSDFEQVKMVNDVLCLAQKSVTLLLRAPDYEEQVIEVPYDVKSISGALQQKIHPPLHLISLSGPVSWTYDGLNYGIHSTLLIKQPQLPFVVLAEKEGFGMLSFQSIEEKDRVTFDLKPAWMDSSVFIESLQDNFYYSLETLFGAIAISLVAENYDDAFGSGGNADAVYAISRGLVACSTLSLIQQLVEYIKVSTL